jgi:hypothetical protein
MPSARVLIVGLDPRALPGADADVTAIERGLEYGLSRVRDAGFAAEQLLVPLEETALGRIAEVTARQPWDAVVIGGGIRKPEALLEFFEAVVNTVRLGAPGASIAFNADGGTSLEAVQRVLARPDVSRGA